MQLAQALIHQDVFLKVLSLIPNQKRFEQEEKQSGTLEEWKTTLYDREKKGLQKLR